MDNKKSKKLSTQLSQTRLGTFKSNFTTINLHKGMHSSTFYKDVVKNHLDYSRTENHILHSASLPYNSKKLKLGSLDKLKTKKNPQEDKEKSFFRETFISKAHKFPQIQHELNFQKNMKNKLDKRIKELKSLIKHEEKKRDKIHLKCNKMLIENEKLKQNTKKVKEENLNLGIATSKMGQQNWRTEEQLKKLQEKTKWTKLRIVDEKQEKDELKKEVTENQIKFREESKKYNELKEKETVAIKTMENNFMEEKRLKLQKALFLSTVNQNSHKKL